MSENKKKEEVPHKGIFALIVIVVACIYFYTTTDHSRKREHYAKIMKEFPNYRIYQWSELEYTIIEKATLISKKITFDAKGNEKIDNPIEVIEK